MPKGVTLSAHVPAGILKDRVWGGRRLHELYRKQLPPAIPVGESWANQLDRIGDISIVSNGAFAGKESPLS